MSSGTHKIDPAGENNFLKFISIYLTVPGLDCSTQA